MSDEDWVRWFGSDTAPINENQTVDIKYRSGTVVEGVRVGDYRWSHAPSPVDIVAYRRSAMGNTMTPEEAELPADEHIPAKRSKYHREIATGVWVDVYDVLDAWAVNNPALQHLIKKALQPGERGHKTKAQDMDDIVVSAIRARELEQ